MTHSPTPDNGLDVGPDNVDGLRMLAGIADTATPQSIVIQATTAALSANPMLDYKDVKRYFTAVLAKVKADAVAEYKAQGVSEEEVEAAAQAHWVQEREDQAPYAHVYADEWHELDWSVMEHHRRRVRPILEAARGAR